MNIFKKALAVISAVGIALVQFTLTSFALDEEPQSKGIAIVHTNDIHCSYLADDNTYGYAELAGYKARLESEGYEVLLTDSGDFSQGGVMGTLSRGEYIIDIMNAIGYTAAAVGNHEFDYKPERLYELEEMADFTLLSCNFESKDSGDIFSAIKIIEAKNGAKVALVGITTPETLTKSSPSYFKDENGNFIYSFDQEELDLFYNKIQQMADKARNEMGADYVIALTHLGVEESSAPFRSIDVINNTNGYDAFLDGHSHTIIDAKIKNKDGKDVILAQTGTKLLTMGTLIIGNDGTISEELVRMGEYKVTADEDSHEYKEYKRISDYISGVEEKFKALTEQVVGKTDYYLTALSPENHFDWIVRVGETNLGDFVADAFRTVCEADIGFTNGGGVRSELNVGDITYGDLVSVQPFGNSLCVVEATGQQILDTLEIGAKSSPASDGSFVQVSGLTYEIHNYIPSSVTYDENANFAGVNGEYRVKNVLIGGEPIDLEKTYLVATHNYLATNTSSSALSQSKMLREEIMLDNQAIIDYIKGALNGVIGKEYENVYGEGRITVYSEAPAPIPDDESDDSSSEDETSSEDTSSEEDTSSDESSADKDESSAQPDDDQKNPPTGSGIAYSSLAVISVSAVAALAVIINRKREE